VTLLVAGLLVDGLLVALSLLLQDLRGYNSMQYGALAAVMTVTSIAAAALVPRLIARIGGIWVAACGLAGLALTALALISNAEPDASMIALALSMIGFGVAMGAALLLPAHSFLSRSATNVTTPPPLLYKTSRSPSEPRSAWPSSRRSPPTLGIWLGRL
jgi:MFS family permease